MSERLTLNGGVCAMASTDYCESQEDCYLCGHGKKMREKLADYEQAESERELSGFSGKLEKLREFHEWYAQQTSKKYVDDVCALTARAEQAEKERDLAVKALSDYEDAIDPTVDGIMRDWTASNCAELTKPIKFPCATCVHHECGYFGNEPCKSCWGGDKWRGLPQEGEGK